MPKIIKQKDILDSGGKKIGIEFTQDNGVVVRHLKPTPEQDTYFKALKEKRKQERLEIKQKKSNLRTKLTKLGLTEEEVGMLIKG